MKNIFVKNFFTFLTALAMFPIAVNCDVMPDESDFEPAETDYVLTIEPVNELPETLILSGNDITFPVGIYVKTPVITTTLGFAVFPSDDRILMSLIENGDFLSGNAFQNQEEMYGGMSVGVKQSYEAEELLLAFGFLMPDGKIPLESSKENYLAHFNITLPNDLPNGTYTLAFDSYPSNTYANYSDSTTYSPYKMDLKSFTFNVRQAPKLTDVVAVYKMLKGDLEKDSAYDFNGDLCISSVDFSIIKREFLKYSV